MPLNRCDSLEIVPAIPIPRSILDRHAAGLVVTQRLFAFGDVLASFRLFRIQLDVALPFLRHVVFMEDRFDRAFWNTRFAIDALFWMDVKHRLALVEAFYRANNDAIGVATSVARLGDNVSHRRSSLIKPLYECVRERSRAGVINHRQCSGISLSREKDAHVTDGKP